MTDPTQTHWVQVIRQEEVAERDRKNQSLQ